MTEIQANTWLKNNSGKKVRWSNWNKDEFVIPTGKWYNKSNPNPYFWCFEGVNQNNKKSYYYLRNGFSEETYIKHWACVE